MNVRVSGVKSVVIVRSVSEGDECESEWSEECWIVNGGRR